MSDAKQYVWVPDGTGYGYFDGDEPEAGPLYGAADFDRVTAERDAALRQLEAEAQGADRAAEAMMEWRRNYMELQQRLTAADEADSAKNKTITNLEDEIKILELGLAAANDRADVLEAENRRLREDDLFYDAACEAMEGHQKERAKLGKEIGCQGSLIDGIAWIYHRLAELESAEGGGDA